jgi:hypothetical protein
MKQISLRLPDALHADLRRAADANRRSLHSEILWRLEQAGKKSPDDAARHEPRGS